MASMEEEEHSILNDLGQEITGIATPVSLCMVITIFLVRLLHDKSGDVNSSSVAIATAGYQEQEGDSKAEKFGGSLLNAVIFIGIVVVMTFIIVILFKYGCVKVILYYMGVATFVIFFFMTGFILIDFLKRINVHMDAISLMFLLFNFAAVGSVCIFFMPAPLTLKQGYLVWTGVVVAYIFSFIPEWTTWILLVVMSLYDLCAVLTPHGPLQMLVNMAIERQEDIPALVYEARAPPPRARRAQASAPAAVAEAREGPVLGEDFVEIQLMEKPRLDAAAQLHPGQAVLPRESSVDARANGSTLTRLASTGDGTATPLISEPPSHHPMHAEQALPLTAPVVSVTDASARSDGATQAATEEGPQGRRRRLRRRQREGEEDGEDEDRYGLGMPAAVKLGLGDFIFYSVLVGRASLYDFMTVYASFIGVIAGLGITLLLLAMLQKALPALPVSIALGILFYFLTRLVLEPYVVPNFENLINW